MSDRPTGQRVAQRTYPQGSLQPSDFAVEHCAAPKILRGTYEKDDEFLRTCFISVDPMLRLASSGP